jgi:hypothetical protein
MVRKALLAGGVVAALAVIVTAGVWLVAGRDDQAQPTSPASEPDSAGQTNTTGTWTGQDTHIYDVAHTLGQDIAARAAFDDQEPADVYVKEASAGLRTGVTVTPGSRAGRYLVTESGYHACLTLGDAVGDAGDVTVLGTDTQPC